MPLKYRYGAGLMTSLFDARGAKEDKEEMGILEYDLNDKTASNELQSTCSVLWKILPKNGPS